MDAETVWKRHDRSRRSRWSIQQGNMAPEEFLFFIFAAPEINIYFRRNCCKAVLSNAVTKIVVYMY